MYERGRRYHVFKNGRYPIPNDDIERDREDLKHAMLMELTDGVLFYAPVGSPQSILDVGTGTGEPPARPSLRALPIARLLTRASRQASGPLKVCRRRGPSRDQVG